MITAPANYSTELALPSRVPTYAVNLVSPTVGDLQYVSAPMLNGGDYATAKAVLRPISLDASVDPRESSFIPSVFRFELVDDQALVTADLVALDLTGWTVTFYQMFHGLDWSTPDYITKFVGIVTDVEYRDSNYRITARSPFCTKAIRAKLFSGAKAKLAAALSIGALSATVVAGGAFQDSGGFFIVGTERVAYAATRDNGNGTWSLTGLTRGYGSSSAAAHSSGAAVQELFVFDADHPFDMLQTMLTNTGEKDGLSLDSSYIDTTGFSDAKTDLGSFDFYIEAHRAENAKRALEEGIFRPTSSYPAENNLGQIRPVLLDTPDSGDFVATITDASILGKAPELLGRFELRANDVVYQVDEDHDSLDGGFDGQYRKTSASLVNEAGRRYTLEIPAKGIQSSTSGYAAYIEGRADAWINRFGLQTPVMRFTTGMSEELLEVADPIFCTFTYVVNMAAGTRGMTAYLVEIIGIRTNYVSGEITFKVLGYPPAAPIPDQTFAGTTVHSETGIESITVA